VATARIKLVTQPTEIRALRRRDVIRQLLLGPVDGITLAPFLAGMTLTIGAWARHPEPGLYMASGVILMLLSAGIYLNRLILGWNDRQERILTAWRVTVEKARDQELDALYRELQQDGDPRTETLLKDLRTLTKAIMSAQSGSPASAALDIVSDVDALFQRSVDYLKESLDLWRTAEQVNREPIRAQLRSQREVLIAEVEKSLENLGDVLGGLKRVAVSSGSNPQLADLRDELKARLRIAEEVEQRMSAMRDRRVAAPDEAVYLKHADP
jgi:hypothetical protein